MRLYLVRHGAAEDKAGREDAARALTARGREDVALVAAAVGSDVERPLHIVSSPYLRAEQTAEILREALKLDEKIEPSEVMLPESDWPHLRELLTRYGSAGIKTVVAVGHNPSISLICARIIAGSEDVGLDFSKAAVACIDIDNLQGRPAGQLRWLVTPHAIRGATGAPRKKAR